jgi:DNA-binding LacI/PurR family transcriptional regulator
VRDAFVEAGVAWDRVPVVERFEHSAASGASATAEVLALDPGITAVIATSDVLALGAIEEIRRRRQRVPEDVSVTGFDGIRLAMEAGLTTVTQPVVEKGRQAGRLLLDPAQRPQARRVMLETSFRVGRTSGPPRV